MKENQRNRARGYKRMRDKCLKELENNVNMRFKLEELISHLDNPMVEIVGNVFKEATEILKEQRLSGFSEDNVQKTMNKLQDEIEEANSAGDMVSESVIQSSDEDDESLNAELQELLANEQQYQRNENAYANVDQGQSLDVGSTFPQVPTNKPTFSQPVQSATTTTTTTETPTENISNQKVAVPFV